MPRITLITNIDYVTIAPVRMHCNALVIVADEHPLEPTRLRCQLRGFSVSGKLPVFDMLVPSIEYIIEAGHDPRFMISTDEGVRPLMRGARMTMKDGPIVDLVAGVNSDSPIDIETFENIGYPELWHILEQRTASYWEAPAMPVASFEVADYVRARLGVTKKQPTMKGRRP